MPDGWLEPADQDVPLSSWIVACKHTDEIEEDVLLLNVLNFAPKHKNDFSPRETYTIRSRKWDSDGRWRLYRAYIGRIEENKEKMEISRKENRIRYPRLLRKESGYEGSESETENADSVRRESIQKKKRAGAEGLVTGLHEFILSHPLHSEKQKSSKSNDKSKMPSSSKTTHSPPVSGPKSKKLKIVHHGTSPISNTLIKSKLSGNSSCTNCAQLASEPIASTSKDFVQLPSTDCIDDVDNVSCTASELMSVASEHHGSCLSSNASPAPKSNSFGSGFVSVVSSQVPVPVVSSHAPIDINLNINSNGNVAKVFTVGPDGAVLDLPNITRDFASEMLQAMRDIKNTLQELSSAQKEMSNTQKDIIERVANLEASAQYEHEPAHSAPRSLVSITSSPLSWVTSGVDSAKSTPLVRDGRVQLGEGLSMNSSAFNTINTTTNERNWLRAMLVGVFESAAGDYCYQPQTKGNKIPFPKHYNNVCADLYRQFLTRTDQEVTDERVRAVHSKLARKARDSKGRRNTGTGRKRGAPSERNITVQCLYGDE